MTGGPVRSAGLCALRDAVDMVPFLCGHYLGMGLDKILFIDDGSRDGTSALLSALGERHSGVAVRREDNDHFAQSALMTAGANRLLAEGYRLVIPFDADEFWDLSAADVSAMAGRREPRIFWGKSINFVQRRQATGPRARNFLTVRYSTPGERFPIREVGAMAKPFVAHTAYKVAFWADAPVALSTGQHQLLQGPTQTDPAPLEIFHLPFRDRSELVKRGLDYEPRRAPVRKPGDSVQSEMHYECVRTGRTQLLWEANSAARSGRLGQFGASVPLVPDARLRRALVRGGVKFVRLFGPRLFLQAIARRRPEISPAGEEFGQVA